MKSIKRAPLLGAGIILLIILLSIIGVCKYSQLKTINDSLQLTIDAQISTIEELNNENIELKEKISELEKQLANRRRGTATIDDRELLARLVFLEANTESLECQKAIASVVINRVNSGYWGNTINSVVYAPNQFTPAPQIPYTTPTATNYEAVDYVLENGVTLPSYVLYFRAGYHFKWSGYVPYTSMGNTYFGYMTKDQQ